MCVCVCVCVRACVRVCVCVHAFTCMHVSYMHAHACTHACICPHARMRGRMPHARMHPCPRDARAHTNGYAIQTRMYIQTRIYGHIHRLHLDKPWREQAPAASTATVIPPSAAAASVSSGVAGTVRDRASIVAAVTLAQPSAEQADGLSKDVGTGGLDEMEGRPGAKQGHTEEEPVWSQQARELKQAGRFRSPRILRPRTPSPVLPSMAGTDAPQTVLPSEAVQLQGREGEERRDEAGQGSGGVGRTQGVRNGKMAEVVASGSRRRVAPREMLPRSPSPQPDANAETVATAAAARANVNAGNGGGEGGGGVEGEVNSTAAATAAELPSARAPRKKESAKELLVS